VVACFLAHSRVFGKLLGEPVDGATCFLCFIARNPIFFFRWKLGLFYQNCFPPVALAFAGLGPLKALDDRPRPLKEPTITPFRHGMDFCRDGDTFFLFPLIRPPECGLRVWAGSPSEWHGCFLCSWHVPPLAFPFVARFRTVLPVHPHTFSFPLCCPPPMRVEKMDRSVSLCAHRSQFFPCWTIIYRIPQVATRN